MTKAKKNAPTAAPVRVEILVCPMHHYYAVAVNDTRVTPSKCCGSWKTVAVWGVDRADLLRDIGDGSEARS